MRFTIVAIATSLALSTGISFADSNSNLSNTMAHNPEVSSYQSSSLNPVQAAAYQDPNTVLAQNNATINQTVNQVFNNVGDGWAVGAQIGATSGTTRNNVQFTIKDIQTLSNTGLSAGLHVDHGRTFSNNFYFGQELYFNLAKSNGGNYNNNGSSAGNTNIGNNIGFDLLPGYQISPISLLYAKLGLNLARLTVYQSMPTLPGDVTNTRPGIDIGVGYRQALTQYLSLALEYDWINYNAKTSRGGTYPTTSRFTQNLFQLSLNYQLDQIGINAASRPSLDFDSPYVGGSIGRLLMSVNTSGQGGHQNWSGDGFNENLKLGMGHQFNSWFYLGGEVFGHLSQGVEAQELNVNFYDKNASYGMSLLPGYILNQSNLLFVRLGVVDSKFTGTYNGGSGTNFSVTKPGVQLGLGFETSLTQFLSLVAEYDYTLYQSFNNQSNGLTETYKTMEQLFSLGVNYRF